MLNLVLLKNTAHRNIFIQIQKQRVKKYPQIQRDWKVDKSTRWHYVLCSQNNFVEVTTCTANHLCFLMNKENAVSLIFYYPISRPVSALPGRVKARGRQRRWTWKFTRWCCVVLSSNKDCLALRYTIISVMIIAIIISHWLIWILESTKLVEIARSLEGLSKWLLCDYCLLVSLQMSET